MENPIDCLDMVIGILINGVSQVRDYYSFSQIAPQPDEFFGGHNSLTSATAYQQDDITTVIFRKPLKGRSYQCKLSSSHQNITFLLFIQRKKKKLNSIGNKYFYMLYLWKISSKICFFFFLSI